MFKIINKKILGISLAIGVGLIISNYLNKDLFIAGTPQLKMPIHQYLAKKIQQPLNQSQNFIASLFNKQSVFQQKENSSFSKETNSNLEKIASQPLKKVSMGVYASNVGNVSRIEYKENEIEWIVYTFNLKGKEIKIKVPKDQVPPSQETLEKIYE